MVNIGFIGAGNMGTAIIKGIAKSELASEVILFATDTDKQKVLSLNKLGVSLLENASDVSKKCKYVFLAVKPQMIDEVLDSIKDSITNETVIVSIAAGITGEYIKKKTNENVKVILVMPNTPLLIGEGATALSKLDPVNDQEFKLVCDIFASCGEIAVIPKDKMKEIIAINGSSPAFIYLFAKGFVDYAKKENIDELVAKRLFAKTLIGSAKMITNSGFTIDELIKMVSSPGGTTLEGLEEFKKGELLKTVDKACTACTKRAYELSK